MMQKTEMQIPNFYRKRQQLSNRIRKQHRNQVFMKNRNQRFSLQNEHQQQNYILDQRYHEYICKFVETHYHLETLNELKQAIYSDDIIKQHYGIIGIRKILSISDDPPIQQIIDAGLIPKFIQHVQQEEFPQLQLEATWILTNVASGTHQQCQSIVDKGVIPLFIKLLKSQHMGIIEQAIWAIGNIATDCVGSRDKILKQGGIQSMISVIESPDVTRYIFTHSIWALSNLCRGSPLPKYKTIKNAILLLARVLVENRLEDEGTVNDAIWAICFNLNLEQQRIQDLFSLGFQRIIVKYLTGDSVSTAIAAMKILSRLTSLNNQKHLELVLGQPGLLDALSDMINHTTKSIRVETCWTFANLVTSGPKFVEQLIKRQDIMTCILNLFQSDSEEVLEQICYIFSNMTKTGQNKLVFDFFKEAHIIKYYLGVLKQEDRMLIGTGITELGEILKFGEKFKDENEQNPFIKDILDENGDVILEELQLHDDKEIYKKVLNLVESYFEKEDPLKF